MEIIISLILAYLFSAFTQVMKDLGGRPIDKPAWAIQPTLGIAIMIGLTWFFRPFTHVIYPNGQRARAIVFGMLEVLIQLAVLTAIFWAAISISTHYFDSIILQVVTVAAIFIVGAPIILLITTIVMTPIILIISLPLDLLFPLKESSASKNRKDN